MNGMKKLFVASAVIACVSWSGLVVGAGEAAGTARQIESLYDLMSGSKRVGEEWQWSWMKLGLKRGAPLLLSLSSGVNSVSALYGWADGDIPLMILSSIAAGASGLMAMGFAYYQTGKDRQLFHRVHALVRSAGGGDRIAERPLDSVV